LAETERELQRKRRAFEEDLGARRAEETQNLIERVNRVIRQIAEAEKYDLIVQEAAYINPAIDITDKVLAALNAQR
jgi:outer membrane protein